MYSSESEKTELSAFRFAEKAHKLRHHPKRRRRKGAQEEEPEASHAELLDFRAPECIKHLVELPAGDTHDTKPLYGLKTHPGFYFAPGAVSPTEQCSFLRDITGSLLEPPAATNLTAAHGPLPGLWRAAEQGLRVRWAPGEPQCSNPASSGLAHPQSAGNCSCDGSVAAGGSRSGALPDFPSVWAADGPGKLAAQLLRKLRWLTVGQRYDWTSRSYDSENPHHALPEYAAALGRRLVSRVEVAQPTSQQAQRRQQAQQQRRGHGDQGLPSYAPEAPPRQQIQELPSGEVPAAAAAERGAAETYSPDAALVCFYRQGDTLCGHQDDVERDITQPIVSLSLGASAVLLLGGRSRADVPTAMLVRHGDAVIFTGPARTYFHGVPRVFDDAREAVGAALSGSAEFAALPAGVREFAQSTRINVSIRCVM